ncbi:DNA primase [hydrothermal vent metagenome]|uniref:DNA primase n=1 Tax=hydrothermal vent metagenome TaxID=652676 RepID=A0A3B1DFT2_9ZZZZ
MKHFIPENIIDEIRSRSDIVEIVSEVVVLKKAGKYFKGLCPFHSEKTPSFTVSPDKQIYHCFGCATGGNVFKFLMETQSLPFVEAVKILASKVNVVIPSPRKNATESRQEKERETLLKSNRRAAEYFTATLDHPQKGKKAREYLESRSFTGEILSKYQLGWSTPNWQDLMNALGQKFSHRDLENAGLIKQKDGGSSSNYYDRFRARLMIPLQDLYGNVIGFGARIIGEGEPKYLNSPETPLYKKGRVLFGMHLAKQPMRQQKQAILVEGYFDQIRAHQKGILNVVATCGTALTPEQAGLLKNHVNSVVLVFDSDSAGKLAAQRGYQVLLEKDLSVKIGHLPKGHDPDSYIQEFGPENFLQFIENAKPFIESYIDDASNSGNLESPAGRMEVVNQVLPLLAKVKNNLERSEWVRYLSEKAGVDDNALLKELKKALTQNQSQVKVAPIRSLDKPNPELYLVHLLLSNQQVARKIRARVSLDEFSDPELRQIGELVYGLLDIEQPVQVDRLLDQVERPETRALLSKIGLKPIAFDDPLKGADDCITELKKAHIEKKIIELKRLRNQADKAGKIAESREIHTQLRKVQHSLIPG